MFSLDFIIHRGRNVDNFYISLILARYLLNVFCNNNSYVIMKTTSQILLVEDDINLSTLLSDYLRSKDYLVDTAPNGKEAWEIMAKKHYDIIITDITMPQMSGLQLMKAIRDGGNQIPIIVLSARNDRDDIIRGYQLGCDDYVTKPFTMDILICKIEAILRRCRIANQSAEMEFDLGGVHFDAVRQMLGDKRLSTRENDLLLMLSQNMGKVVERNRILMSLWGDDTYFNARSLSVYVNHLRNYIGKDCAVKILSVHGKGYKMVNMDENK